MATVFKRHGTGRYIVEYTAGDGKKRTAYTKTTDRRAAEAIGAKLEAEAAQVRFGVVDARAAELVEAERRPIREHVDAYLAACTRDGQAPLHV